MGIVLLLVSYYCNYWHNTATTGFRLLLLAYFYLVFFCFIHYEGSSLYSISSIKKYY